ncbi:hypothetical protein OsI_01957 [Oryza sativa Indica Group]|uniref:GST N-terminal domain-containing protein n=1 Tax=Oryza sativa subsp. indica TaxID=39946 RepID=B8A888_ORYSI|nr:hypothetical protein OsI_01957 [Oryza sativa Indica Group]
MAPMKVYGWVVSPWMARVLVALEEAGAEYEVVPMSRSGGDHRRPEHLARNVQLRVCGGQCRRIPRSDLEILPRFVPLQHVEIELVVVGSGGVEV